MASLNLSVGPISLKATAHPREAMGLAHPGPGSVAFRILAKSNGVMQGLWLGYLCFSGKPLKQFASDFVDKNYPGTE